MVKMLVPPQNWHLKRCRWKQWQNVKYSHEMKLIRIRVRGHRSLRYPFVYVNTRPMSDPDPVSAHPSYIATGGMAHASETYKLAETYDGKMQALRQCGATTVAAIGQRQRCCSRRQPNKETARL